MIIEKTLTQLRNRVSEIEKEVLDNNLPSGASDIEASLKNISDYVNTVLLGCIQKDKDDMVEYIVGSLVTLKSSIDSHSESLRIGMASDRAVKGVFNRIFQAVESSHNREVQVKDLQDRLDAGEDLEARRSMGERPERLATVREAKARNRKEHGDTIGEDS